MVPRGSCNPLARGPLGNKGRSSLAPDPWTLGLNTLVASIDTSLIHLACWCGYRPMMLAHRWPDGRWLKGSWQNIDILEQDTLFDWEPPIQRLIERIRNHDWDKSAPT